jgi:hypothetical protein
MEMKYQLAFFFSLVLGITPGIAQPESRQEQVYDSVYARRIMMTELDGVYIPKDLFDAFAELERLSTAADIQKFKTAPEEIVRTRLHFGLGRWMIVNWGFYDGSRLSHFLKEKGLLHPDDMARVILVCFHRHLNHKELNFSTEVEYYQTLREQEAQAREREKEVLSEEKRVKKD